jgi:hypothetical protein
VILAATAAADMQYRPYDSALFVVMGERQLGRWAASGCHCQPRAFPSEMAL